MRGRRAHRAPRPRARRRRCRSTTRTSMRSMTATRTSTASAEAGAEPARAARPRIGLLGDHAEPLRRHAPGHHRAPGGVRARGRRRRCADVADVVVAPPVKERADAERAMRELEAPGLDGLLVVMLTYGPAMRVARAAGRDAGCRSAWRTSSPSRRSRAAWDMADLTYNQGIHGAQDTANAMVRAGRPFHVDHRRLARPTRSATRSARWARAAAAVTRWRSLKVARRSATR